MDTALVERHDVEIVKAPTEVLASAHTAAKALASVIAGKHTPVIFNGEQYLEFEDWQTVGKFYGLTAQVEWTKPIQDGTPPFTVGYEAQAIVVHAVSGQVISRAESMCMNDERNWKGKPLFQLRSMAQTRACAKAFRNVLAWVVVLAGFRPTPAEEMEGVTQNEPKSHNPTPDQLEPYGPSNLKGNPEAYMGALNDFEKLKTEAAAKAWRAKVGHSTKLSVDQKNSLCDKFDEVWGNQKA